MVYDERWQAVIITWSICRTIPLVIMVRCSRRHNTSCWYHRDTSWLPHSKSPMMVLHEKCSYSWQFRGISYTFLAKISSIGSQNSPVCREHRQFKLWAETWTPWNLKNPWISISWLPTIYMPSQPRTLSWWHWWLRISQSRPIVEVLRVFVGFNRSLPSNRHKVFIKSSVSRDRICLKSFR